MATPQSPVYGTARLRDLFAALSLSSLAMLHVWGLPQLAAQHGGWAFIGAWLLGLLLLVLPLLLLELLLGRRSRRSPLEGLAFLTREADAPRGWRVSAWASTLASLLALVVLALIANGSLNLLLHEIAVASDVSPDGGMALVWPLGTGILFVLAAGLSVLGTAMRRRIALLGLALMAALLLLSAVAGVGMAQTIYKPAALSASDWREAARLALLSLGGGLGVIWLGGTQLPREASLGRLALGLLLSQAVLALLLLFALAPFAAAALANTEGEALRILPSGVLVWLLLSGLILLCLLGMTLVAEPLLLRLKEKGIAPFVATVVVFGVGLLLAEGLWFWGQADAVHILLSGLAALLLLVQLGLTLFGGWAMKISHARKELALPSEGIYNLWRVAVRIVVPLAILWALTAWVY